MYLFEVQNMNICFIKQDKISYLSSKRILIPEFVDIYISKQDKNTKNENNFFAMCTCFHQKYSQNFVKLRLMSLDYFNDVLTMFLSLDGVQESARISSEVSCVLKMNGFGTTRVIIVYGCAVPLNLALLVSYSWKIVSTTE